MFGILIVDDEVLIREGIADGIEWRKMECEEPILADNGLEAIHVIQNHKIDIVIADVKMPGMNGLALAKWVSENRSEINIIILSGYDDFQYVQSALSSGVVSEYILKPTKFDDLTHAIEKVKGKLRERYNSDRAYHKAKKVMEDTRKKVLIDNFVFHRIVNSDELRSSLQDPGMHAPLHRLTVVKVYSNMINFPGNKSYTSDLANDVDKLMEDTVSDMRIGCYVQYEKDEILFYYYPAVAETLRSSEFMKETDKLVYELYRIFKDINCFDIFIGTSGLGNSVHCLRDLYLEAVRQCDSKKPEDFSGSAGDAKDNFYRALGKNIDDALWKKDYRTAGDAFEAFISRISGRSMVYQKSCAIELMNHSADLLSDQSAVYWDMQKEYERIIGAEKGEDIVTAVRETLQTLCAGSDPRTAERHNNGKLSETIIKYIKRNYFKDLTLDQVAEKFYISPGHLCRLLRQEANKTFLDILTEGRVENARILIKDQRLKIYEVGSLVGFEDSKYFSQVFKKYTGYTPSEYRKENGKDEDKGFS